ncbi:hypothetical protein NUG22_17655 [Saccharothrix longispora]|nr:hypothetical protein [Saccharothrix longispora]
MAASALVDGTDLVATTPEVIAPVAADLDPVLLPSTCLPPRCTCPGSATTPTARPWSRDLTRAAPTAVPAPGDPTGG